MTLLPGSHALDLTDYGFDLAFAAQLVNEGYTGYAVTMVVSGPSLLFFFVSMV